MSETIPDGKQKTDWVSGYANAVIEHERDGSNRLTKGTFNPGNYRFHAKETVTFEIGSGLVQENSTGQWRAVGGGEDFTVYANRHFEIRCANPADFKCDYFDPTDG